MDETILPGLLENNDEKIVSFVNGFVRGRHLSKKDPWLETINLFSWTPTQINSFIMNLHFQENTWNWIRRIETTKWEMADKKQFLLLLPFVDETWKLIEKNLGGFEKEYWADVKFFPWSQNEYSDIAIQKLLEYKRPWSALKCIYVNYKRKGIFNIDYAVTALLDGLTISESNAIHDRCQFREILKYLQNDLTVRKEDLLKIEWGYLPFLIGLSKGASPKTLEKELASNPDFFCEIIKLVYRSKNEAPNPKEGTEQQINLATNGWKLLDNWTTVPGTQDDGSFKEGDFGLWLEAVKTKCKESGHIEVALLTIGKVLIHCTTDPSGLWIHKAVAEVLNSEDSNDLRRGFRLGIVNSRGCHFVDPTGKQEFELMEKYRNQADGVENAGYYRFACTLRGLADFYEKEAKRIIEEHKAMKDIE